MRFEIELSKEEVAITVQSLAGISRSFTLSNEERNAIESLNFKLRVLESHLDGTALQVTLMERAEHFTPLVATSYNEDKKVQNVGEASSLPDVQNAGPLSI